MSKVKGKAKQKARKQKGKPTQKKQLWTIDYSKAVAEQLQAAPGCAFDRHLMRVTPQRQTKKDEE